VACIYVMYALSLELLHVHKERVMSRNSLARGSILNFLNSFMQDTLLMPAIILMIFFFDKYSFAAC
jgi:hypothetical protein